MLYSICKETKYPIICALPEVLSPQIKKIIGSASKPQIRNVHICGRSGNLTNYLKVHKIENFFDSNFGICVFSLLVMSKY
jgi:hypothetical protein